MEHDTTYLDSLPLEHFLIVESLSQLIHHNFFLLTCIINIRGIANHKMTSVGLEPQWYVVCTTMPLARC
jgi:hypothetical protein